MTIQQAAQQRADLADATKAVAEAMQMRVGDYARSRLRSKALRLDASTAQTSTNALEDHVLPALGDYFYDQLKTTDAQKRIDDSMIRGWTTTVKGRKDKKRSAAATPVTRSLSGSACSGR